MATNVDLILNLRSAREWNSRLEEADGATDWKSSSGAEERGLRVVLGVACLAAVLRAQEAIAFW